MSYGTGPAPDFGGSDLAEWIEKLRAHPMEWYSMGYGDTGVCRPIREGKSGFAPPGAFEAMYPGGWRTHGNVYVRYVGDWRPDPPDPPDPLERFLTYDLPAIAVALIVCGVAAGLMATLALATLIVLVHAVWITVERYRWTRSVRDALLWWRQ